MDFKIKMIFSKLLEKIYPFKPGNKIWGVVLLKAYLICILFVMILGIIMNSIVGQQWLYDKYA